jgi:hypothetical protein
MDESTYVSQVSVVADTSFAVLDAAVGRWLASEFVSYSDFGRLATQWVATSSASSHHTLMQNGRPSFHINLRAVGLAKTVIQLVLLHEAPLESLYGQLANFWEWFGKQQDEAEQLPNIAHSDARQSSARDLLASMPRNQRGPAPAPHNEWARDQVRRGLSLEEILPEYMERRGLKYNDEDARTRATEALRKTIERARKL